MKKTITKIGNSQGIIFDSTLMKLTHLKVGGLLNVELHQGGTITLTPLHLTIKATKVRTTAKRK
jgi:antitoxin component of MazEF toxin-antitoxin module